MAYLAGAALISACIVAAFLAVRAAFAQDWHRWRLTRAQRRCQSQRGHEWFPNHGAREFVPSTETCLQCDAARTIPPYGECLGGHPISEHYSTTGQYLDVRGCAGAR